MEKSNAVDQENHVGVGDTLASIEVGLQSLRRESGRNKQLWAKYEYHVTRVINRAQEEAKKTKQLQRMLQAIGEKRKEFDEEVSGIEADRDIRLENIAFAKRERANLLREVKIKREELLKVLEERKQAYGKIQKEQDRQLMFVYFSQLTLCVLTVAIAIPLIFEL
mmetsp:Transcript_14379/g.15941  ORF Transcript_14379/g.15941 Transcript_14379/m.15941 type:complete len:165 (+) Transcript_14379:119-613(+)